MNVIPSTIPDVLILEPKVFGDERGFFFESYNEKVFAEKTGLRPRFVQDNHSRSIKNVLRGLHYQIKQPQGKLINEPVMGNEMDLANPNAIHAVLRDIKPHLIVNAAAHTAVDKAESEPELAMALNAIAAGELAPGGMAQPAFEM